MVDVCIAADDYGVEPADAGFAEFVFCGEKEWHLGRIGAIRESCGRSLSAGFADSTD